MSDRRTPVVLVPSLFRDLGATVAGALLDRPGTVVVHHDVGRLDQGVVVRTVSGLLPDPFGGRHEDPCEASAPADDDGTHATTREEHS